jgi:hypothetical protein
MLFATLLFTALSSHGSGYIDVIDMNDNVITVIGSNRHTGHLDWMDTYPWYGPEHVHAIRQANDAYADALAIAKSADSYYAYHHALAIANTNFIKTAIEIRKNCTDANNTLCQNDGPPENVSLWTIYTPLGVIIVPLMLYCIYKCLAGCCYRMFHKKEDKFADLL